MCVPCLCVLYCSAMWCVIHKRLLYFKQLMLLSKATEQKKKRNSHLSCIFSAPGVRPRVRFWLIYKVCVFPTLGNALYLYPSNTRKMSWGGNALVIAEVWRSSSSGCEVWSIVLEEILNHRTNWGCWSNSVL